jgi:hypothetical protein
MQETHLAEVKHKGELKLQHLETLACGRLLHVTIHWKNRLAATRLPPFRASSPQASQAATHWPARLHPTSPPLTGLLTHWLQPTTAGLQHHQMLAPNMPRRCKQIRLDVKWVTPELHRLKVYCSWTRDFFPFFLFFKCLLILFTVWLSTISPYWFLWFSFFFFLFLLFLFSPFLVLLVLLL